jgi:hypothetical protein
LLFWFDIRITPFHFETFSKRPGHQSLAKTKYLSPRETFVSAAQWESFLLETDGGAIDPTLVSGWLGVPVGRAVATVMALPAIWSISFCVN